MNALLRVELLRFRSRRMIVVFAGAALLGVLIAGAVTFLVSNRDFAAATARARQGAIAERQECMAHGIPPELAQIKEPPVDDFCGGPFDPSTIVADPRFHMVRFLDVVKGASGFAIVLALLLGASFSGSEWHHRTITTSMTWEPRRFRLLLAKATASSALTLAGAVAVLALLGAALVPAAAFRGTMEGTDAAWLRSVIAAGLRGATIAAIASVIGVSIASIGRSTVAAVGVVFGYLAVLEGIMRAVKPQWERWLLGDNAALFVAGTNRGAYPNARSTAAAGALLAVYTIGLFLGAAAIFRRRDVA